MNAPKTDCFCDFIIFMSDILLNAVVRNKSCWLILSRDGRGHYGFIHGANLRPGLCTPRRVIKIALAAQSIYGSLIKMTYRLFIQNSIASHRQIVFKSLFLVATWQPVKLANDWVACSTNTNWKQVSLNVLTLAIDKYGRHFADDISRLVSFN